MSRGDGMRIKRKMMGILVSLLLVITGAFTAEAASTSGTNSNISAQVPSSHTIRIEKEHVTVTFEDEEAQDEEGISDTLAVERFSEPTIQIVAEKGWKIKRILLGDQEITDQLKDGYLTLDPVCEDLTLTIETQEDTSGGDDGKQETEKETEKETVKPGAGKDHDNKSSGHQPSQDQPNQPKSSKTAVTGDMAKPMLYGIVMLIAGLTGIMVIRLRKKE